MQNGTTTWNITDDVSFRLKSYGAVPEPATLSLMVMAILALACLRLVRVAVCQARCSTVIASRLGNRR